MFKDIYYDNRNNNIHLTETYNGKDVKYKEKYERKIFVNDKTGKSDWKDIYGNSVVEKTVKDKQEIENIKEVGFTCSQSDLSEETMFLQERYRDVELNPDVKNFNIAYMDIEIEVKDVFPEPELAEFEVNLITVISSKTGETVTWGNREYTGEVKGFEYRYIPDEHDLLDNFITWWRKQKFDVVTGWNVKDFDMQYLINRMIKLGIEKTFSPYGKTYSKTMRDKQGKKTFYCTIAGLIILDYLDLYKNFTYTTLESFSLNFVSMYEKIGGKLDLEGHINDAYIRNWNLFVEYNIQDTVLVQKMEAKKKFIQLAIRFCSEALVPISKVFSSVAVIEGFILRKLHQKKMVMPDRPKISRDLWKEYGLFKTKDGLQNTLDGEISFNDFAVKGGYVEANRGLWFHCQSYDVESLYPHNMMQFNISPETKVFNPSKEDIKERNLIKSPMNGIYYTRKQGIIPEIVSTIFQERRMYKQKMFVEKNAGNKDLADYYDSQQMIRKILINSMYGVLANKWFHFYDVDNARCVTRAGRNLIRFLSKTTNDYFHSNWHNVSQKYFPDVVDCQPITEDLVKVIDTDSNYICLDEVKQKYAPDMDFMEFSNIMEKEFFDPFFEKILKIYAGRYGVEQIINFKREGVITKQFVLAKKKYLTELLANEDEVYEIPKLKATGVEIKRSDTPKFCRDNIESVVKTILDTVDRDQVMTHLRKIKKKFKMEKIQNISFNKGINGYTKYAGNMNLFLKNEAILYKKMTPMHIRASINGNYLINKYNLPYMEMANGSKIKYIFLNKKNEIGQDIVAFIGNYPKEYNKLLKIDYETQFEKSFLGVIQRMFDVLQWGDIDFKAGKLGKFFE